MRNLDTTNTLHLKAEEEKRVARIKLEAAERVEREMIALEATTEMRTYAESLNSLKVDIYHSKAKSHGIPENLKAARKAAARRENRMSMQLTKNAPVTSKAAAIATASSTTEGFFNGTYYRLGHGDNGTDSRAAIATTSSKIGIFGKTAHQHGHGDNDTGSRAAGNDAAIATASSTTKNFSGTGHRLGHRGNDDNHAQCCSIQ